MTKQYSRVPQLAYGAIGIATGISASAGFALSVPHFFWQNFAFYWLPQAMVLATLLPFRPQPALLGGMAAALAGYFVAFGAWVFSSTDMDSMAWVGYLFSFPGAVIGAIFSKLVAPHDALPRPIHAFLLGFGFVAGGILVNQGIVCATVISCGVR